ncbi:MAG: succinate dehydrogenase, cytochrome b556 subunit [Rhodoferax sp.]|jgi:succinate dehydrogenase / fumarate reductase cytochrome b subunit
MTQRARRPVFLNLTQIAMPVGALTSIGHRISGVILAVAAPASIYLFALSMRDEMEYARVIQLSERFAFKAAAVIAVWALALRKMLAALMFIRRSHQHEITQEST